MRKIIKIRRQLLVGERSDNMLYEFQPIWSTGCRFELKMHVQITNFLLPRNRKKTKIRRHPKLVTNQQQGSVSVLGLSMEVAVDFQWIPPEAIFPLPRFAPRPLSRPSLLSPYKSPLEPG